ncbi:MAG: hypothetical protein ACK4SY_04050 [Pyrobaculum sp.]
MEIVAAATAIGRRRFFIDLTHWPLVERRHKPFLVNSGWPPGLSRGAVDISSHMKEVEEIYREVLTSMGEAYREVASSMWKTWALRLFLPARVEPVQLRDWEVKTHVENVIGRKFAGWGDVYVGKTELEFKGRAAYVGGRPSVGHTYLYLLGAFR